MLLRAAETLPKDNAATVPPAEASFLPKRPARPSEGTLPAEPPLRGLIGGCRCGKSRSSNSA